MRTKVNSKNEYRSVKCLTYIFVIIIAALMIPSCSISSGGKNPDLTIDYEITTTINLQSTNTGEALYESTTNETETEFDSLRSELEYNHGEMISYQELQYRNWSVFVREDSPTSCAFFIDFTEDTSVEENIAMAEQDINAIETTLENIKTVHIFWFDTNGDILGRRVSNLNRGLLDFIPDIMEWFNDDYKEAYLTLHPDEEEQSQTTSDKTITAQTETTEPPTTTATNKPVVTIGQKNALNSAKSYLSFTAFSYNGLIEQLEYEGFTNSEALYAVDNCGADWNEQAVKCAKSYLNTTAFSYEGLIEQLEYEGFTHEQAVYGADNSNINTKDQALESALSYLKTAAFSYSGLIEQLEYEGFSHEEAVSAVDKCGADWNEQAKKCAKSYLKLMEFSKNDLIDQLEYEGFTHSQAVYGVEANGL